MRFSGVDLMFFAGIFALNGFSKYSANAKSYFPSSDLSARTVSGELIYLTVWASIGFSENQSV